MNLRAGWMISAGLLLATPANAEMLTPHQVGGSPYLRQASDFVEPYEAIPPQLPPPRYVGGLLPPQEVYTVLRESGFSPLGAPRLRGNVWTIAAISRDGEDGRLFIDATNGRLLRFMPVNFDDEPVGTYGAPRPMPVPSMRTFQRPPAPIPHVASRAVPAPQPVTPLPPMPKPVPAAARPAPPAPAQSTVVESPLPSAAAAPPPPAAPPSTIGQAKPAPQILPTQEMPKAQDLEY